MSTRSKLVDNYYHLEKPCCIDEDMIIIISKKINNKFTIMGYGNLVV